MAASTAQTLCAGVLAVAAPSRWARARRLTRRHAVCARTSVTRLTEAGELPACQSAASLSAPRPIRHTYSYVLYMLYVAIRRGAYGISSHFWNTVHRGTVLANTFNTKRTHRTSRVERCSLAIYIFRARHSQKLALSLKPMIAPASLISHPAPAHLTQSLPARRCVCCAPSSRRRCIWACR